MLIDTQGRGRLAFRPFGWLVRGVVLFLLTPGVAQAQVPAAVARKLGEALQVGQGDQVQLTWTTGRPGEPGERLRVENGRASLSHCEAAGCQPVGSPLTLSSGQRGQLGSVLRAADLPHLRSADAEAQGAADRTLELAVDLAEGAPPLARWQLARSDWPTPPDGYGVAEFLDELVQKLRTAAQARQPVPVPTTVAELQALRLQLRLTPRTRPGGLVTIEHGTVHVEPAEGSLPRSPPPRAWERPLSVPEQEQLLAVLQAAQFDKLDQQVPRRTAPAIGDDDGRLAALHLIPEGKQRPAATASSPSSVPRGVERYLADLLRSSARPLCEKLVELLLSPQGPAAPPLRTLKGKKTAAAARQGS